VNEAKGQTKQQLGHISLPVWADFCLFCFWWQFMGDFVNAIRDYQAAVKIDPSYALAYYNAANVYFRQRQFQQVS